jgi:hypothetical protein
VGQTFPVELSCIMDGVLEGHMEALHGNKVAFQGVLA